MKILKSKKIIVLLVALVALLWAIQLYKDDAEMSLLEKVESRGSRVLGTRLDVDDAYVDWASGEISLSRLVVANPGGFSNANMISVDAIEARADFESRVIDRVRLSGVDAVIEFRGARSNFETVGDRMAKRAAGDGAAAGNGQDGEREASDASTESGAAEAPPRDDWVVESIEFVDIHVRVTADWSSREFDFDAGGLSIESLDAGTDDLVRAVAIRFLDRVLVSAANQAEDDRLKESLMEKAEALRAKQSAAD